MEPNSNFLDFLIVDDKLRSKLKRFIKLDFRCKNFDEFYSSFQSQISDFLNFVSPDVAICYHAFAEKGEMDLAYRVLNGAYELTLDDLTGLQTRKHLNHRLRSLERELCNGGNTFSVAMGDIDNFKGVNDKYGHLIGDEVLRRLKVVFDESIRPFDSVYRWGGEEFAFIFPETEILDAYHIVERVRKCVEDRLVVGIDSDCNEFEVFDLAKRSPFKNYDTFVPISCSFGVSEFSYESRCVVNLMELADEALFVSKKSGKNQVSMSKK